MSYAKVHRSVQITLTLVIVVLQGMLPLSGVAQALGGTQTTDRVAELPQPAQEGAESASPLVDGDVPDEIAQVPGVTEDWWTAVQAQIRQDMYALSPDPDRGSDFRGTNPAHGLDFTFTPAGLNLTPAQSLPADSEGTLAFATPDSRAAAPAPEPPPWTWNLSLSGYGYQGSVAPAAAPADLLADGAHIELPHGDLTEWYQNGERGLEHGFTLPVSPAQRPAADAPLVLELALTTDLIPQLSDDGQTLDFTLPGGNVSVLRYSDLHVTDSAGRQLPAHLSMSPSQIAILIDDTAAAYPLTVDPLIFTPDWTATGENPGDEFGAAVAGAGDVNGDGFADVIVGAPGVSSFRGKVYVYYGSFRGLSATPGWTATGANTFDQFGYAVAGAGDVNGDGFDDVIVGAYGFGNNAGKTYVYYGSQAGLGGSPNWTAAGTTNAEFGYAVGTAGDVNGDGYADVIVGEPLFDTTNILDAGKAYVYYGSSSGLNQSPEWTVVGENENDFFGTAVSTAGDVNGDGYDDFIVRAFRYSRASKVYVYHGSDVGLGITADWSATGEAASDGFGSAVAAAGDVNGDGYDDIVVGAPNNGLGGTNAGKVYVYHGSNSGLESGAVWTEVGGKDNAQFGVAVGSAGDVNGDGFDDVIIGGYIYSNHAYLYQGSPRGLSRRDDWAAVGEAAGDQLGWAVATAGDVNGDGYADILFAAPFNDQNGNDAGKVYLFTGSPWGVSNAPAWAAVGEAANDMFGSALGPAGDVNGDGYDDVLIGAYDYNDNGNVKAGKVYLVYGSVDGLETAPAWVAAGQLAHDELGRALGTAGDVNGDGYADLLIGAPGYPGGNANGRVYLYFGSANGPGTSADWIHTGTGPQDKFGAALSTAGDVNGDGYDDFLVGAPQHDTANTNAGRAYLFTGSPGGPGGSAAWTADGSTAYDNFGAAVSNAGDVNGDGYADVLIGASGGSKIVDLFYGSVSGPGSPLNAGASFPGSSSYMGLAGDVNGDGYADFVVGTIGTANRGLVNLKLGSASGIVPSAFDNVPGESAGDRFGFAITGAGDVNGDGYADLLIGAPGYDMASMADAGRVTVYYGEGDSSASTAAWHPVGENLFDRFGEALSAAGDVNGDGYADFLVGAPEFSSPSANGKVYLYSGSNPSVPIWSRTGQQGDFLGSAVSGVGDVNGDGYADILVSAPFNDQGGTNAGKVYLYYGSLSGPAPAAWTARGESAQACFGESLNGAGDVNGDGFADFLVSAPRNDIYCKNGAGKVYLYYGSQTGPVLHQVWSGESDGDSFGFTVGTGGDVNGDGFADILVGAPFNDQGGTDAGKIYLYYGASSGPHTAPDWTATGEAIDDHFGYAVATAGDVNGDGYADVVAGAPGADEAYIYHGSALGLDVPFSRLASGTANIGFGQAVSAAGDVNGDGYADVMIGAPSDTPYSPGNGEAYLYRGTSLGVELAPAQVFAENALSMGRTVSTAGDVDGDGFADVIVGAPASLNSQPGNVYIYQGNNGGGRLSLAQQLRNDGSSLSVHPWDATYEPNSFVVSLKTAHPMGRGRARLQVQACPAGVPFGAPACLEFTSTQWTPTDEHGIVTLSEVVDGLEKDSLYHWRARAIFDSPFYHHTPWRRYQAQAQEADLRTGAPASDLYIRKTMVPTTTLTLGDPLTYTLQFGALGSQAVGVVITDILPTSLLSVTVTSSGAPISDTGASPGYVWQVGTLAAGESGIITITGIANEPRFINTAVITAASRDSNPDNNTATVQTRIPGVLFVDQSAPGPLHNGQSWLTAYTDLQDALGVAGSGDEIWVAAGVYKPTSALTRTATFTLTNGVKMFGGFAGNEIYRYQRDWGAHPTTLSGDIGTPNNSADNVYHVVTLADTGTLLDGFTITGGNADGNGADAQGGGTLLTGGSPMLSNIAFLGNKAQQGGGMFITSGSPHLVNVTFSGNSAGDGGGVYLNASGATLINVTLNNNAASANGGGIYAAHAVTVKNSILWGNTTAISGTQIYNGSGSGLDVTYSDVQGGWSGTGNLDANPQFFDADGADNIPGTLDDDLRLHTTINHPNPLLDAGDNTALPGDSLDLDGDGNTSEQWPYDLSGRSRLIGFTIITPTVDMGAYEANILDVLAEADAKLAVGVSFRMEHLQLLPADTLEAALQNYSNFNDGEWFYDFCADYNQIDDDGYCPADRPNHIRNDLLDTADLYRVALNWPTAIFTPTRGSSPLNVWQTGGQGVLDAAEEITNDHMVFGNEFLVDATDYRFSTTGVSYADQIIQDEIAQLDQAYRQFELVMDLVIRLFTDWGAGDYATTDHFEVFGVASSRMISTLAEKAARYYMMNDTSMAREVYEQALTNQNAHLNALAAMAEQKGVNYLQNGGYEMLNNMEQLRARAKAIQQGLDFFGFSPNYVPLQSYDQLLELVEGPTGNTGLLGTARDLEDQARDAQRTFDANASDMATELDNLTVELNDQLFELCGQSPDDYVTCTGGLMLQNLDAVDAADRRASLARLTIQNIIEQITIEEERAGQVINLITQNGDIIRAKEEAIGEELRSRTTTTKFHANEGRFHVGASFGVEVYAGVELEYKVGWIPEVSLVGTTGFKATLAAETGIEYAHTWGTTHETVIDESAVPISKLEGDKAVAQAITTADIEGTNRDAVIKNLLLQQLEAEKEYEIAMAEATQLIAEHNFLVEKYNRLLNKRELALRRVATHNSHLLNPAYRIWRDSLTVQSSAALNLAAQFAYLTARAAEYEVLTPYPNIDRIFRARTANDIRLFLDGLKVWYQALALPGQLNRYPYELSLAQDILGLTGQQSLVDSPACSLLEDGTLECRFITSLNQQRGDNQYLFSPNIWNNRLAGVGAPLATDEGVWVDILTPQGNVNGVEVVLIHGSENGGAEAYRNAKGELVYYDPGTAVPVGYQIPTELSPANTTVVLHPAINGAGAISNGGLVNLSVASQWILRIPANSKGNLDFSQIKDIELHLDTTGRALPGRAEQALQDAQRLQSRLPLLAVSPAWSQHLFSLQPAVGQSMAPKPLVTQPPAIPGEIGGNYYGNLVITSPVTVTNRLLNIAVWNPQDGTLTGTVETSALNYYPVSLGLHGTTTGNDFFLVSDAFTITLARRVITQSFSLSGAVDETGNVLRGVFTSTITNLLPQVITEQGHFFFSRPEVSGGNRLIVDTAAWQLPLQGSTFITATVYNNLMQVITTTPQIITFTTNLGMVQPSVVTATNGSAVVSYVAGSTPGIATIVATNGTLTNTVQVQIQSQAAPTLLYLPIIWKSPPSLREPAPDLVVEAATVTGDNVQVVIKNQGNAPVPADSMFWIDLYVDPNPVPDGVNQPWASLSYEGLVWSIPTEALPLAPGATMTLTYSTDPGASNLYYRSDLSYFTGSFSPGTPIYIQVDSWKPNSPSGAVLESHEIVGGFYNNILGPVLSTAR